MIQLHSVHSEAKDKRQTIQINLRLPTKTHFACLCQKFQFKQTNRYETLIDSNTSLFVRKLKISSNGEGPTCNVAKPPCTILEPQSALYKSSYRRKCSGTELYISLERRLFRIYELSWI